MKNETYNGWTNWDTWNVATVLMNDENIYSCVVNLDAEDTRIFCYNNRHLFMDTDLKQVNWIEVDV